MKINNDNLTPARAIDAARQASGQPPAVDPVSSVGPAAQVEISEAAQSIASAKAAADAAPEVREALIADLRFQVEAGTYRVSSAVIADRIFQQAREYRLAA